jgi:hypothetical protein
MSRNLDVHPDFDSETVISNTDQDTLFFDNFTNSNLTDNYRLYGRPTPFVNLNSGKPSPSFESNGDANYASGVVSKEIFNISEGLSIESDMYVKSGSCWHEGSLGLARSPEQLGTTNNQPNFAIELQYRYYSTCYNDGNNSGLLAFGFDSETGERENFRLITDEYLNKWNNYRIDIDNELYAHVYVNDELLYSSENRVDFESLNNKPIHLGRRSYKDGGVLHDNLLVKKRLNISVEVLSLDELHPILSDNKISPGEELILNVRLVNESSQDVSISNINPESSITGVTLRQSNINQTDGLGNVFPFTLSPGQSQDVRVPVRIINWPESGVNFDVQLAWEYSDGSVGKAGNIVSLETWLPETHYHISEISKALNEGSIGNESIISTSYVPYFKYDRQKGLKGMALAIDLISLVKATLGAVTQKAVTEEFLESLSIEVLTGTFKDIEKETYSYLWGIAGTSTTGTIIELENLTVANNPSETVDLPDMFEPAKALVIVRKISEHIDTESYIPLTSNQLDNIPGYILEPLSFVTDTLDNEGYIETSEAVRLKPESKH